eukprot:217768-Rhodomonas_salina.1
MLSSQGNGLDCQMSLTSKTNGLITCTVPSISASVTSHASQTMLLMYAGFPFLIFAGFSRSNEK